jgi:hypothetical protein
VESGVIYFTLRRFTLGSALNTTRSTALQPVTLTVHTKALGLPVNATGYTVTEIAQATGLKIDPLVVSEAETSSLSIADLPDHTTYVLEIAL